METVIWFLSEAEGLSRDVCSMCQGGTVIYTFNCKE